MGFVCPFYRTSAKSAILHWMALLAYIGLEHVKSDFGVLVDEYERIWDFEGDTIDFKLGDVLFGKLRPYLAKAWPASFG